MEITSIENCGRHRGVSQLALTAGVTILVWNFPAIVWLRNRISLTGVLRLCALVEIGTPKRNMCRTSKSARECGERVEQSVKPTPLQRGLPDARLAVVRTDHVFASLSLRLRPDTDASDRPARQTVTPAVNAPSCCTPGEAHCPPFLFRFDQANCIAHLTLGGPGS